MSIERRKCADGCRRLALPGWARPRRTVGHTWCPACSCSKATPSTRRSTTSASARRRLQRLRNIEANPDVAVLVDHYWESWDECWWLRLRGRARILQGGDEFEDARGLLMARYQQYTDAAQIGPVIRIDEWVGWQARG